MSATAIGEDDELRSAIDVFQRAENELVQLESRSGEVVEAGRRLREANEAVAQLSEQITNEYNVALAASDERTARRVDTELGRLAVAADTIGQISQHLDQAQEGLDAVRVDMQAGAGQLGDTARELRNVARGLAAFKPEQIDRKLDEITAAAAEVRNLLVSHGAQLASVEDRLKAHTADQTAAQGSMRKWLLVIALLVVAAIAVAAAGLAMK